MHDDEYDYPVNPAREGMEEQRQIFGAENPDKEYILTGWDVWVTNPFYTGEKGMHPEDDPESYEANKKFLEELSNRLPDPPAEIYLNDCPF